MTSAPARPQTVAEIASRLCFRAVEFRAQDPQNTDGRTLEGYAAVFDVATEIDSWEGSFSEVIARGAFKRTLGSGRMPVLQFDHGRDQRTGSVPIGAIGTLREDKTGLFVSARLFDNPVVEPIRQAIEGRAIDGMSFRFRVIKDTWTDNKGATVDGSELLDLLWQPGDRGPLTRTIQDVDLLELGPVVFPAYEATTVGVRSALATLAPEDREHLVRELLTILRAQPEPAEQDDQPAEDSDEAATDAARDSEEPAESGETPDTTDDDALRDSGDASDSEPADDGTSDPQEPADLGTSATAAPASRSTAHLGNPTDWWLPAPGSN